MLGDQQIEFMKHFYINTFIYFNIAHYSYFIYLCVYLAQYYLTCAYTE